MKIKRVFTKDFDPAKSVKENLGPWKKVDVRIDGQDGKPIFEMRDAEFPEHFSQQACDIIASKYFRATNYKGDRETSYFDVINRMATFWKEFLKEDNLLESDLYTHEDGEDAVVFYEEVMWMLYHQMFAPNSPQWFNSGVNMLYDIDPPFSLYCWKHTPEGNDNGHMESEEPVDEAQTSACFILEVQDTLEGMNSITEHYETETRLFKGGSGVGTNFSPIRAEGERLSGGGTSSGVMSFLDGLDRNAGAIKSGGTTRRAAKMVILDIDHPEIEKFINWKVNEERKAKVLIEAGYDGSMGGEAYSTVSGQNSNNSVRVNEEFMQKVMNLDTDPHATITLKGRVDDSVNREVSVGKLWDEIANAAWECADPGIQFDDRYNEWNTCPLHGRINATNPCSEFAFLDNSACNLASLNLMAFIDESDHFNFDWYRQAITLTQMVLEASVEGGAFPTWETAYNSAYFRPTGLGLTNLASLLLYYKLPYDSDMGRNIAGALAAIMCGESYKTSWMMAKEAGSFPGFEGNGPYMVDIVTKHKDNAMKLLNIDDPLCMTPWFWDDFEDAVAEAWIWFWSRDKEEFVKDGFRNAQVTVMAPTGTISFAMDCGSTGIEPFYSHTLYKKCSDGSFMEITNPLYDPNLPAEVLATANDISPEGHLKMMAAIQPFISGSISKTVNMPNWATPEDIKKVYLDAYNMGLKSVSVYRDGSKGVQPLTTKKEDEKNDQIVVEMSGYSCDDPDEFLKRLKDSSKIVEVIDDRVAPKRIKPNGIRKSRTHAAKIGEIEMYVTVGYYDDGTLAELFASSDKDGTVIKGLLTSLSKAISYMLQYGIEPLTIAKMLRNQKFEPSGVVSRHPNIKMADSISDLIAKIIEMECGNYWRCEVRPDNQVGQEPAEEVSIQEVCPNCGSVKMVQSGTCKTCLACGSTTGCA